MRYALFICFLCFAGCSAQITEPEASSEYKAPVETGDGWITVDLSSVGIDEALMVEMADRIRDGSYTNIHSVLIARNGKLVFESYFPGVTTAERTHVDWNRDHLHAQHSVTKSVTSSLIGLAIQRGLIESVDTKISTFFPDYADAFQQPHKTDLTIHHLLTMTAGLEWDEHTYNYFDSRNTHVQLSRSADPIGFALNLPSVTPPGQEFRYNSGLSMVLGEIVFRVSGLRADDFAREYLFDPLGIESYFWYRYPDETVQTGGGLALRPRDMAKFGQLYLDNGMWNDERILSEDWVRESTRSQMPASIGHDDYGLHWWMMKIPRHDNAFDLSDEVPLSYAANGRGGQWIWVYPEWDLVVVFTGGNDNELAQQPVDIVRRFVFPAVN